jgi:hypothetical protein
LSKAAGWGTRKPRLSPTHSPGSQSLSLRGRLIAKSWTKLRRSREATVGEQAAVQQALRRHRFASLPFFTAFFAGAFVGAACLAGAFAPVFGPEGIFAPYLALVVRAPGMAYSAFDFAATFVDGRGRATGCFFASFARFCF